MSALLLQEAFDALPYEVLVDVDDPETWLAARAELLTASDVSAVLGINPWCSALQLWLRKTGQAPAVEENEAMEVGRIFEPAILHLYERRTGRPVSPGGVLLRSRRHPWLGCTLDAWTTFEDGVRGPLESKWSERRGAVGDWEACVPPIVMGQVQAQLLVTGAERASTCCLIGRRLFAHDVFPDPRMQTEIVERGAEFMRRVKEWDPPLPDGSESAQAALDAMYPAEEVGKVVVLDQDAVAWDERLAAIDALVKTLTGERDALRQRIEAALGDAEQGVLPGGLGAWRWATQHRGAFKVEERSFRVLRRVKT